MYSTDKKKKCCTLPYLMRTYRTITVISNIKIVLLPYFERYIRNIGRGHE